MQWRPRLTNGLKQPAKYRQNKLDSISPSPKAKERCMSSLVMIGRKYAAFNEPRYWAPVLLGEGGDLRQDYSYPQDGDAEN